MFRGPPNAATPTVLKRVRVPALTVTGPVKVLATVPFNWSVPKPSLTRPAEPLMAPLRLDVPRAALKVSRLELVEMAAVVKSAELAVQVWGALRMMLVVLTDSAPEALLLIPP